jgi:CRP/FNR family transcriptional regulator
MTHAYPNLLPAQSQQRGVEVCKSCLTGNTCIFNKVGSNTGVFSVDTHRQRVFQRGEFLHRQGDRYSDLLHLRVGMLKKFVLNAQGDEFVTGFIFPGEMCGIAQLGDEQAESVVCVEDSVVCELDSPSEPGPIQQQFYRSIIRHVREQGVDDLQQKVWARSSIQARFAAFCLNYSSKMTRLGREPTFLSTPMSRTDLANYLSMSLESLSRVIHSLHENGVVRAELGYIELKQMDTLKVLAAPAML